MLIAGKDGQQVDIKILGYQYPDNSNNEWDANWLRIYLNVKSNVGQWQTVDPSLTSWEFKQLTEWFADLASDKKTIQNEITFTEPNLSFYIIKKPGDRKIIQIRFDLESRPQSSSDDKDYFIDFNFSKQDLATISADLKKEYDKFPIRLLPPTNSQVFKFNICDWISRLFRQ